LYSQTYNESYRTNRHEETVETGKLGYEELFNFYFLSSSVRMRRVIRMKLAGHVAYMKEIRNDYHILIKKLHMQ
jgi:hypothetical protein